MLPNIAFPFSTLKPCIPVILIAILVFLRRTTAEGADPPSFIELPKAFQNSQTRDAYYDWLKLAPNLVRVYPDHFLEQVENLVRKYPNDLQEQIQHLVGAPPDEFFERVQELAGVDPQALPKPDEEPATLSFGFGFIMADGPTVCQNLPSNRRLAKSKTIRWKNDNLIIRFYNDVDCKGDYLVLFRDPSDTPQSLLSLTQWLVGKRSYRVEEFSGTVTPGNYYNYNAEYSIYSNPAPDPTTSLVGYIRQNVTGACSKFLSPARSVVTQTPFIPSRLNGWTYSNRRFQYHVVDFWVNDSCLGPALTQVVPWVGRAITFAEPVSSSRLTVATSSQLPSEELHHNI
ncbi:MAG: hypothetical protein M1833_003140 [Piccolia ochrophora]|nr:MAG: hypothetical protein M1833_003140 [Piccolia ochrophora]